MHKTDENLVVNMQKVNKWFGEFHALKDINLSIYEGERIVVCGPSGSGKSTLIRCLNGLEKHQDGTIKVHGTVLDDNTESVKKIRKNVGMVFQQFNLFPHLTVMENCILAPMENLHLSEAEASKLAMSFLERVQIPDQANKLPGQLSGGQQQRVAIARALCMQPRLMLFDEPTSSLDPEMIKEVLDTMVALANDGMSMICVTHELNFARRVAHRVIFMDEGKIVEDQSPKDFFENPQTDRARLFLSQILTIRYIHDLSTGNFWCTTTDRGYWRLLQMHLWMGPGLSMSKLRYTDGRHHRQCIALLLIERWSRQRTFPATSSTNITRIANVKTFLYESRFFSQRHVPSFRNILCAPYANLHCLCCVNQALFMGPAKRSAMVKFRSLKTVPSVGMSINVDKC